VYGVHSTCHIDREGADGVRGIADPLRLDRSLRWIVLVVTVGTWIPLLDSTMVNVAIESLSRELHTGLGDVQWVVSGYQLAMAAAIPVAGWAARRVGPSRLFLLAIGVFTVCSALCGLAGSAGALIAFRILQGIGGGLIVPAGQMILVQAAGPARLAKVMGVWGTAVVLAPVAGPTIGGLLLDAGSWRWIFFVNVPIGVVAVVFGLSRLPSDSRGEPGRFDLPGLAMMATGLVALTYGLAKVGANGRALGQVVVPLLIGVMLVVGFVLRARRINQPLLDVRLFRIPTFSAASLATFFLGVAMFGGMILMPLYLQGVRHQGTVETGLLLAPLGAGSALGMWISPRVSERLGAGMTAACGCVVSVIAVIPFTMISDHTSYVLLAVLMFFQGSGSTLAFMPVMVAAFRVLRQDQISDAAPIQNIIERFSASLGVAILSVVLAFHLEGAGNQSVEQARAFSNTYLWVVGFSATALVPIGLLVWIDRRHVAVTRGTLHQTPELTELVEGT
jgi:EmrB/QacA subfamily drug resistance transporter